MLSLGGTHPYLRHVACTFAPGVQMKSGWLAGTHGSVRLSIFMVAISCSVSDVVQRVIDLESYFWHVVVRVSDTKHGDGLHDPRRNIFLFNTSAFHP